MKRPAPKLRLNRGPISHSELKFGGQFDFLVIGGGNGGCATAGALSALDSRASIGVIEAGPPTHDSVWTTCPLLGSLGVGSDKLCTPGAKKSFKWDHVQNSTTGGSPSLDGRALYKSTGCGLGGNSLINDCTYVRGHPRDFKSWGSEFSGWSFDDVLPHFKAMEQNLTRGSSASPVGGIEDQLDGDGSIEVHQSHHGGIDQEDRLASLEADLVVSDIATGYCRSEAGGPFLEACGAAKLPENSDFNGVHGTQGYGMYQLMVDTTDGSRRVTASKAHLHRFLRESSPHFNPNLHVMTNTFALELLFDEESRTRGKSVGVPKCIGVRVAERDEKSGRVNPNTVTEYFAENIILAGGALQTPALLQRSGLGDWGSPSMRHLDPENGKVLVNPHIGQHYTEQPSFQIAMTCFNFRRGGSKSFGTLPGLSFMYEQWKEWQQEGTGHFCSFTELGAFIKSETYQDKPDLQLSLIQLPLLDRGRKLCLWEGLTAQMTCLYPHSRGWVQQTSKEIGSLPDYDPCLLMDVRDLGTAQQALAWGQLLVDPGAGLVGDRMFEGWSAVHPYNGADIESFNPPEQSLRTNVEKRDWITANVFGSYGSGSCSMGHVVDEHLRVLGVEGLRIADASVIPQPIGGNVDVVAQMIGARCGEFLMDEQRTVTRRRG